MTTITPPASRNDPCPCGSGRRYKQCHGGDARPPEIAFAPPAPADTDDPVAAARAALRAGDHARAAAIVERHHGPAPDDIVALKLLAEALRPADPDRSRACWERAHRAAPDDPEPMFFLGEFCRDAGDHARAIGYFERALVLAPGHPALLNNLGLALEKAGRLEDAESVLRRALEVEPDAPNAIANLAQNLFQQGRHREAIPLFDRAIRLMPAAPAAIWANRAVCYRETGDAARAAESLVRASEIAPDSGLVWHNLGVARTETREFGLASLAFERALALGYDEPYTQALLLHSNGWECVWRGFAERRARVLDAAAHPTPGPFGAVGPFILQVISDDPALERAASKRWARAQYLPPSVRRPPRRAPDGKLNLGFVSTDLHEHPVGRLVVGLLERIDRERFRVNAYSPGKQIGDRLKERLTAAVDTFRAYPILDVREVADAIRGDAIDVAFDLTGYTGASVANILALRPAPVQVNFLGFTGTMGSPAFDWILSDRYCIPDETAAHYDERPLHIDPCYLPSDPSRTLSDDPLSRREYGLPDGAIVFACQMSAYKILPETFDAWLEILRRVDGSVLWLRRQSVGMTARLREIARSRAIEPSRLVFVPSQTVPVYLARFRLADLFLDTVPFGAHTTVNDALFAGLPVITCTGRTFASRASASQVRAAGLGGLVAHDLEGYVRIAVEFARDPARLRALTTRLRERRDTLPLFDLDRYARQFEAAVERAWAETPSE